MKVETETGLPTGCSKGVCLTSKTGAFMKSYVMCPYANKDSVPTQI